MYKKFFNSQAVFQRTNNQAPLSNEISNNRNSNVLKFGHFDFDHFLGDWSLVLGVSNKSRTTP